MLAVAEVQAYVVAAYRAATRLSAICGGPETEQRDRWGRAPHALAERFDALFWMDEHDNYALALDGEGERQLDVDASSIAGTCSVRYRTGGKGGTADRAAVPHRHVSAMASGRSRPGRGAITSLSYQGLFGLAA